MYKLSILKSLSVVVLVLGCNHPKTGIHQLKMSRPAENEGELFYQAYYLRNDTCFPRICRQLNKIIVSHGEFYLNAFFDIYTNGNIQEIDWNFSFNYYTPRYEGVELTVCIENEKMYLNGKLSHISELRKNADRFLFHSDSSLWHLSKEGKIDFFGKAEFPMMPVALIVDGKRKRGLSVEEWRFFFDCMNEIIMACDNRMNEISLEMWDVDYESVSIEKKEAIWNIAGYNINLFLDRDCRFYFENFSLGDYIDSIKNLQPPTIEGILDIH
jgi:hypothetical protein